MTLRLIALEPTSRVGFLAIVDRCLDLSSRGRFNGERHVVVWLVRERFRKLVPENFSVSTPGLVVCFRYMRFGALDRVAQGFRAIPDIILIYWRVVVLKQDVAKLRIDSVLVGDAWIAICLRRSKKPFFELNGRSFVYLYRIILMLRLISGSEIPQGGFCQLIFDWHYYERVLYRAIGSKNLIFNSLSYRGSFGKLSAAGDDLFFPFSVALRGSLDCLELQQLDQYMSDRLKTPSRHFSYLIDGGNKSDGPLLTDDGSEIIPVGNQRAVVMFLHSFVDGFVDSYSDGFSDLFHYTVTVVEFSLLSSSETLVFIKPHPQGLYDTYPADKTALLLLKKRFAAEPRVIFIASDSPLRSLGTYLPICHCHHGSVAEECAWLGYKVIAFSGGPWLNYPKIFNLWRNPSELKNLCYANYDELRSCNLNTLQAYIYEYRLNCANLNVTTLRAFSNAFDFEFDYSFEFSRTVAKKWDNIENHDVLVLNKYFD